MDQCQNFSICRRIQEVFRRDNEVLAGTVCKVRAGNIATVLVCTDDQTAALLRSTGFSMCQYRLVEITGYVRYNEFVCHREKGFIDKKPPKRAIFFRRRQPAGVFEQ